MIGRLGYGELNVTASGGEKSYFVDGGFVQVKGSVVSILTSRALSFDELDREEAKELLANASSRVPTSDSEFVAKERDQERARRMLSLSR